MFNESTLTIKKQIWTQLNGQIFSNIGTQGVQELFFCELKGSRDSRIKSMTSY